MRARRFTSKRLPRALVATEGRFFDPKVFAPCDLRRIDPPQVFFP